MVKISLLTVLTKLLIATLVFGQRLKPDTTINVNGSRYKIEQVNRFGPPNDYISIASVNNVYRGRNPKIPALNISLYQKMEKGSILKAFLQVFNDARLKELASTDRGLAIFLYIATSGKVTEVGFLVRKTTTLTPLEIEQLENSIKSNVSFKIKAEETNGADFFIIPMEVKYQYALDKKELQ